MLVLCNFLKILMVSDKTIHKAFITHVTLQTKPIREIFHFHYLPKLYIDFKKKEAFSLISHMFIRIFFLQGSQVVGLYYILWPQCYLI